MENSNVHRSTWLQTLYIIEYNEKALTFSFDISLLHILNVFFDVLLTSEVYAYSKTSIKATPNSGQSLYNR